MTSISFDRTLPHATGHGLVRTLLHSAPSLHLTLLRVALGAVMLPHGLQKTVGLFGGHGFNGTMQFFTAQGIPVVLAFLAILAESAGAIALIAGFTTRIAAIGIASVMLVASTMHRANGFFMNWTGTQSGEGFEYHILAFAMAAALVAAGGGRYSIDRAISRNGAQAARLPVATTGN